MGLCNGFQFRHLGQGGLTFISFSLTMAKRGGRQELFPPGACPLEHPIANVSYYFVTSNISARKSPRLVSERRAAFKRSTAQMQPSLLPEAVASRPVCAERYRPLMEREWFHLCHLPFSGLCQPCVSEKQESGKSAAERMAADLPDSFCISEMSQ